MPTCELSHIAFLLVLECAEFTALKFCHRSEKGSVLWYSQRKEDCNLFDLKRATYPLVPTLTVFKSRMSVGCVRKTRTKRFQ